MKIIYAKTPEEVAKIAADVVADVIKNNPKATMGLATGSSPVGMYNELARKNKAGEITFKDVHTVNLDEYVGLPAEHDQSYVYFMRKNLFYNIDIKLENTNLPNGMAEDAAAECKRYDSVVAANSPIDIQVLGIGNNGHIGFNEPTDHFSKGAVLVELTDSTIDANSRFFEKREDVPTRAISMGIGQIMQAKKIIMVAQGKGKAEILERAFFGPVTPMVPASILQFANDVVLCADAEALSVIMEKHPEAVTKA